MQMKTAGYTDRFEGAGFSIEDATVLANELLNNSPSSENRTLDFSGAIQAYAKARAPRSKSMTTQSYWTGQLGLAGRWWWRLLRDFATTYLPLGGDPKAYVMLVFARVETMAD
jgi:2-polyprenyl-6-methoxyphenol hydroxylase-like FAD-dependent oxidoreductase